MLVQSRRRGRRYSRAAVSPTGNFGPAIAVAASNSTGDLSTVSVAAPEKRPTDGRGFIGELSVNPSAGSHLCCYGNNVYPRPPASSKFAAAVHHKKELLLFVGEEDIVLVWPERDRSEGRHDVVDVVILVSGGCVTCEVFQGTVPYPRIPDVS